MEQSWMYITVELQALHSQSYLEELVHSKSRVRSPVCHNFDDQGLPVCAPGVSRMKPVPIALLLAAVLLTTHIPLSVCRPRDLSVVDDRGYKKQLDEVLLRAEDSAVSYLLGEKLLQYLQQRKLAAHRSAPLNPPVPVELDLGLGLGQGQGQGLGLGLSAETPQRGRWREVEGGSQEELVGFSKRNEEPPISIDLTFHLLRNMIEMARIENQREQAELNRKYLDEVGK